MSLESQTPIICFTRVERFSAAHRLNSIFLTEAENAQIYGPCNHIHGHGHNYKGNSNETRTTNNTVFIVEFTIKGRVDMKTGMVVPLNHLKQVVKNKVLNVLDHVNLDLDIEWFKTRPSTTENLAIFIWESTIQDFLPWNLHKIKIWETDNNIVVYKGKV